MSVVRSTVTLHTMLKDSRRDVFQHRGLTSSVKCIRTPQHRHSIIATASDIPNIPGGPSIPGRSAWWDRLNRKEGIRGPDWKPLDKDREFKLQPMEEQKKAQMGEEGYRSWEGIKKEERQRAWDAMRLNAHIRYEKGEMPEWFDPEWLKIEEAPVNTYWREQGAEPYQTDEKLLAQRGDQGGPGGVGGGGGPGGSGGSWWWNEDDPYWSLRDWGDHPMRWWTLLFAGVLAVGGLMAFFQTGCAEAVQIGCAAATVLTGCSMAMSDMTYGWCGHIAVKVAWSVCALLAFKEVFLGWRHQWRPMPRAPHMQGCGWTAISMCVLYMWTGMSGFEPALPMNPGGAFKLGDAAVKHRVWERWGYGGVQMR